MTGEALGFADRENTVKCWSHLPTQWHFAGSDRRKKEKREREREKGKRATDLAGGLGIWIEARSGQ